MSDVPEGYRMSEVGFIPEDWEVKTLGNIFTFGGGYSASRDQLSSDGHCYLHYGDIHKSTKSFIDVRAEYSDIPKLNILLKRISPKSLLHDGDIVFVDASEDDEGTSKHIVVVNNENITYISGLHTIVAKSKVAVLDNEYKRYCFQSRDIKKQFYFYAVGTKVSGISKTNIAKLKLPIPPLPEQQAIASALSDVDALIAALEQLITKKRNIKQGAMQQLLTGEKRLPGFGGAWEVKKLGEIADIDPDNLSNSTDPEYSFHYISLEDVDCGTLRNTTELLFKNAPSRARRKIRNEDILLSTVRPNLKSHLLLKKEISNWICSTGFAVVRCRNNIAQSGFVFNHLFSSVIDRQIETLTIGSNYPAINSKDVKSLLIPLPPTIEEQRAIAQILSDMDAEIEALEQKQAKYKAIKQGMMQELLTGKTRLV